MKKLFRSIVVLALIFSTVFAFAGCKIINVEGTWMCNKMTKTTSYSNTTTDLMQYGSKMTLVLNEDGSMQVDLYAPLSGIMGEGFVDQGEWTLDGTTVKLDGNIDRELEWKNDKLILVIRVVHMYLPDENGELTIEGATEIITIELVKEA